MKEIIYNIQTYSKLKKYSDNLIVVCNFYIEKSSITQNAKKIKPVFFQAINK